MKVQAGLVLISCSLLAGCQNDLPRAELQQRGFLQMPKICGAAAAIGPRVGSEIDRKNPPACTLPDAATIARQCAIYDQVNDPDYNPAYNEMGEIVGGEPLPEYGVSNETCEFISDAQNEARCLFDLAVPRDPQGARQVELIFKNVLWRTDTAISHSVDVFWMTQGDCTVDDPKRTTEP
ncbi:MAG: hypothetical protein SXU28_01225 [Pseudomonadota bacterium]|nr:hypothetical protein [Pseudomonadota bacterium]